MLVDELALSARATQETASAALPALAQLVRTAVDDVVTARSIEPLHQAELMKDARSDREFWRARS